MIRLIILVAAVLMFTISPATPETEYDSFNPNATLDTSQVTTGTSTFHGGWHPRYVP